MEVNWVRNAKPPINESTTMSNQLVVITNKGYLNIAYYHGRYNKWYFEGSTVNGEEVVAWLEGLEH